MKEILGFFAGLACAFSAPSCFRGLRRDFLPALVRKCLQTALSSDFAALAADGAHDLRQQGRVRHDGHAKRFFGVMDYVVENALRVLDYVELRFATALRHTFTFAHDGPVWQAGGNSNRPTTGLLDHETAKVRTSVVGARRKHYLHEVI